MDRSLPRPLLELIKLKQIAWQKLKRFGGLINQSVYKNLSARVKREAQNFHKEIESRIIKNPSVASFYRYIGSKISPHITSLVHSL